MGNNKYESEEVPKKYVDKSTQEGADVKVFTNNKKKKGILLISDNRFFTRLWFQISNPFRYLFTGKLRY